MVQHSRYFLQRRLEIKAAERRQKEDLTLEWMLGAEVPTMYLKLIFSQKSRAATSKGIRLRSLKTFAATRSGESKNEFLSPSIKNHVFATDGEENCQSIPLNNVFNSSVEALTLPSLSGNTILSHVNHISERQISRHRKLLNGFVAISRPPIPDRWVMKPGWTCYRNGFEPESVDFPDEDTICFDAEVCVRESFAPVLATAVSSTAWYSWMSPVLTSSLKRGNKSVCVNDLIPLGNQSSKPRIVVGHYVCYDSARVQECYDLPLSGLKFFDTMAAHISISGITDLQKYFLLASPTKPKWANLASGNSLSQLHLLYCGKDLDKTERDVFVKGSLNDIAQRFQELCTYCAMDVEATHSVFGKLFPTFLERCPHGATLSAILELSSMFIPVTRDVEVIVQNIKENSSAEDTEIKSLLQELAVDALGLLEDKKYREDPWMWDQDWSVTQKSKSKNTDKLEKKNISFYPEWYRKLTSQGNGQTVNESDISITFRMNIAAKLMQLCWGKYPLHYERNHGWGMLIPASKTTEEQSSAVPVASITKLCKFSSERYRVTSVPSWKDYIALQNGITATNSAVVKGDYGYKMEREEGSTEFFIQNGMLFKKLHHSISMEKNVGGALSMHLLVNPSLRSGNIKAQKVLTLLRKNLFWKRHGKEFELMPVAWCGKNHTVGAIVPAVFACSDFTRHPREQLFTSLCSESNESSGVEISRALRAPDDWSFLSANIPDVDMWMTSLLADSVSGSCGSSPLGELFAGGVVYSSIAEDLKLTTLQAEWLVHAVMWGATKRFLAKAFREINPVLSKLSAYGKADTFLQYVLGSSTVPKPYENYQPAGVLSDFQIKFREVYHSETLETPILHCRLSRVLESDRRKFSSLIQNWLIRSSVVDYLHVLMLCFREFVPSARICSIPSFKSHIKFLVPENEKYYAAKSLHIAHLYAVAFCAAKVGLNDVPKIAAELPYVTLSTNIREDFSSDSQKLTFLEALKHPNSNISKEN